MDIVWSNFVFQECTNKKLPLGISRIGFDVIRRFKKISQQDITTVIQRFFMFESSLKLLKEVQTKLD
jgi:hypothetical protein